MYRRIATAYRPLRVHIGQRQRLHCSRTVTMAELSPNQLEPDGEGHVLVIGLSSLSSADVRDGSQTQRRRGMTNSEHREKIKI